MNVNSTNLTNDRTDLDYTEFSIVADKKAFDTEENVAELAEGLGLM